MPMRPGKKSGRMRPGASLAQEESLSNDSKADTLSSSLPRLVPRTWDELEASKARLAASMDRTEFLRTTQNKLTDLRATQTGKCWAVLRHHSEPSLQRNHFNRTLASSVPSVRVMFDEQQDLLRSTRTMWKRVRDLNKFVVHDEEKRNGPLASERAEQSAKTLKTGDPVYPGYEALLSPSKPEMRDPAMLSSFYRESPTMAVKMPLLYKPPLAAMQHGTGGKMRESPSGKTAKLPKIKTPGKVRADAMPESAMFGPA